ncbi:MAG: DnaJ domain-containing protein [Haloarculaceae archaeon]
MTTYYDLLGVSPEASTEEIERAYRERLKEAHPDVSDAADASDRTRRLIEARDVLTDASERARYDRLGHEGYVGLEDSDTQWAGRTGRQPSAGETGTDAREAREASTAAGWSGSGRGGAGGRAREAGANGRDPRGSPGGTDDGRGAGPGTGRRAREHVGAPSWSGHREARAGAARAWNPDSPYAVHRTDDGLHGSRLSPVGPSLVLLAATFLTYPVLVAGVLFPGFPLLARVLVAGCALGVVAYLQSVPEVGMVVFGTWSVLGPAVLVALGVSLVSVPGAVVAVATGVPLGLSVLVRVAVR